jgi:hypothetical protein
MNKRLLSALIIIALSVIILILNTAGRVSIVVLPGFDVSTVKSIAFLVFISLGVVIGLLLR